MDKIPAIRSKHIVEGLGCSERPFLAICHALFDDSTLTKHLKSVVNKASDKVESLTGYRITQIDEAVKSKQQHWHSSRYSDDELRLLLWIRLRDALALNAKLSATFFGAEQLGDDLSAAMIHLLDPPPDAVMKTKRWIKKKLGEDKENSTRKPVITLHHIVVPILEELIKAAVDADSDSDSSHVREELLEKAVNAMENLSEEEQQNLREQLGVEELNRDAAIKMLATGGGLAAIGSSVGLAGFSAYILAAQASAFIPLVSGPGLVSFLSVISNPVTILAVTVGAAFWLKSSVERNIKAIIATRIVAMLAIHGVGGRLGGTQGTLRSFKTVMSIQPPQGVDKKLIAEYQKEWRLIQPAITKDDTPSEMSAWHVMDTFVEVHDKDWLMSRQERHNTAAVSAMTIGDMLYSAAMIEPEVINAADFSYLQTVDGPVAFSFLADALPVGAFHRLKGYVAEQVVANELVATGHAVSFPEGSNQAGWDLLVDGDPYQVKFREGIEGIEQHFSKYDFPVIANLELAQSIPDEFAGRVFFIDGLTNEEVTKITEESVSAADALTSPNVPAMAFALSTYRSAKGVWEGRLTKLQATEQLILDGTVRSGLAATGAIVGVGAGLVFFGPAGAWVFGTGLPILAQSQTSKVTAAIKKYVRFSEYENWADEAHAALDAMHEKLRRIIRQRLSGIKEKYRRIKSDGAGEYVRWRLGDLGRFTRELELRLAVIDRTHIQEPVLRMTETLRWLAASQILPAPYQLELSTVSKILERRPSFIEKIMSESVREKMGAMTDRAKGLFSWV